METMSTDIRPAVQLHCPDCAAKIDAEHDAGCDVARCLETGLQRLSCRDEHDCGQDVWTGLCPGLIEAAEYGVDLNTLTGSGRFRWDRVSRRWTA